jgi:acylphosphatase
MAKKRVHVIVHGRVQGVFFRDYTRQEAQRLGLTGWVRNLPDRTVEAEFQGDGKEVDSILIWLRTGSPHSEVTGVQTDTITLQQDEVDFRVRYEYNG